MMRYLSNIKQYKHKIRVVYWGLVLILMVFVLLPMFFFFYLFDETHVKQMLISQFDNNNYHVSIEGAVLPKFWHGLSLKIDGIYIATKKDDQLFYIKTLDCQLSWISLALGNYKVRRIALNNIAVNEKNILDYGIDNLLNISTTPDSFFGDIQEITVDNVYTRGKNIPYTISNGELKIYTVGQHTKFNLGFGLGLESMRVTAEGGVVYKDNHLKFNDFHTQLANSDISINATANAAEYGLSAKELHLANLNGDIALGKFTGQIATQNLVLSLDNLLAESGRITLHPKYGIASQDIDINFSQALLNKFNLLKVHSVNGNYKAAYGDGNQINMLSELRDFSYSLKQKFLNADCHSILTYTSPKVANQTISAHINGNCNYNIVTDNFKWRINGDLDNSPLAINLEIESTTYSKPHIYLTGNLDTLDLSKFAIQKDQILPFHFSDNTLPFAWLVLFDANANITINHFVFYRLRLNNLQALFSVANDELDINQMRADIYSGVVLGKAIVTKGLHGYTLGIQGQIANLSLEDMLHDLFDVDAISGRANLNLDVGIKNVNSYDELHKGLNGSINIEATDGAFRGVDFNLFANPNVVDLAPHDKSTIFQKLSANFNFANGVSRKSSLAFSSPYVIANGGGVIDFYNQKIDYSLKIKSALPQNVQKISSVLIPVGVSGDLFDPQISIQNIHLYTSKVGRVKVGSGELNTEPCIGIIDTGITD